MQTHDSTQPINVCMHTTAYILGGLPEAQRSGTKPGGISPSLGQPKVKRVSFLIPNYLLLRRSICLFRFFPPSLLLHNCPAIVSNTLLFGLSDEQEAEFERLWWINSHIHPLGASTFLGRGRTKPHDVLCEMCRPASQDYGDND